MMWRGVLRLIVVALLTIAIIQQNQMSVLVAICLAVMSFWDE
jgi:hypothetical protein